jgi:hypothetical protein
LDQARLERSDFLLDVGLIELTEHVAFLDERAFFDQRHDLRLPRNARSHQLLIARLERTGLGDGDT